MSPSIIFAQYTKPEAYPPLEHASRILANAGWDVLFLGIEGAGQSRRLVVPSHERIQILSMPHCEGGVRQKIHYLQFVRWVVETTVRRRPTAIYCSDLLSTPAGLLCASLLGTPVCYHEHDTPGPPNSRFMGLARSARRALSQRALLCVIPNERRRRAFELELNPRRSLTVWNCPSRAVPAIDEASSAEKFVLWYQGSLVPSQLPLQVIDALALLPATVELRFVGYETVGHPRYAQELLEHARALGVGDRVHYLGVLPSREEMYREAAKAHLGLALFAKPFREPMVGASNKPWEYLACGLPVLSCDDEEWRDWVIPEQVGEVCDPADAKAIARAVARVMRRPDHGASMGGLGRSRIAEGEWSYERQFAPVLEALEALVQGRSTR